MASRSVGTLLSEFNAAYVPPALMPGYQGHVPGVAFAFGASYGTNTFRYFQDHRNAAMEKNFTCFSRGSSFPTVFSSDLDPGDTWPIAHQGPLALPAERHPLQPRQRRLLGARVYGLHSSPSLPGKLPDDGSILPSRPPLSPKKKWHLLRVSPGNVKTYQTFPSGKRVSLQERQKRDCYFEFRA
uniref:Ciliary microtubule inner protein 2C n=1 Tax=Castor canadensis TaxID=51338 RepID=A0A8C0W1E5_CASCN